MRLVKIILIALCMLGAASGSRIDAQPAVGHTSRPDPSFTQISQREIAVLLADVAESNPMVVKNLEDDPELRRAQIASLRQLLAFASEAQKTGLADDQRVRNELENIRAEVIAVNYDKQLNKNKDAKPLFGYISGAAVASYWGEVAGNTLPASVKAARKKSFDEFLATKFYFLVTANPELHERAPTDEEKAQAREFYAKIRIYAGEYAKRSPALPLLLRQRIALQVKLQQAQFLARLYREKLSAQVAASDEEIANYLKKHPELDTGAQRAKAEKILARAKAGEDFGKLANEFTEDPGNKNQQDELQGGLYANVKKGVMVEPFERAALALESGQVSPELVETPYGFHIVKLERKSAGAAGTYDVRHILVATGVGDPSNPSAQPTPVKEYARKEVETEKEKLITDRIVAANKISVPEDFVVPTAAVPEAPKVMPASKKRLARKRT